MFKLDFSLCANKILSFMCLFGDRIPSLDFPKDLMTLNPWPPYLPS